MGSRQGTLIESWDAAREKGESGQLGIRVRRRRRGTSDGGLQNRRSFQPG